MTPITATDRLPIIPDPGAGISLGTRMPMRLLLVDDNAINLKIGITMLAHLGYTAEMAEDGQKAVTAIEQGEFDLVLMDVQMPILDGYEAAKIICRDLPEARRPIIVALTASVLQTEREQCLACGMSDFLSKPVRIKELQLLLERWYPAVVARHSEGENQPHSVAGSIGHVAPVEEDVVVNMERLLEMCDHNAEMLREIVELYYDQADTSLAKLSLAVEQQQFTTIDAIAHKLAGSSATCGMVAMAKVLRQMEVNARESRGGDMVRLLELAAHRLAQLRSHLALHLNASLLK